MNQGNFGTDAWQNNGDGTFTNLGRNNSALWPDNAHMRFDDYDMDGKLDVVTKSEGPSYQNRDASIRVFRNVIENNNTWLKIQLRQGDNNSMGIGGLVTVYKAGTDTIIGNRMLAVDTVGLHPRLHFGLGEHQKVDIVVVFPGGRQIVSFNDISVNRYIVMRPNGSVQDVEFGLDPGNGSIDAPPSRPGNVQSSLITSTGFMLRWDASTDDLGVSGYEVFIDGISQGTVTVTSMAVVGLVANTTYSATVRAFDAAGNSATSFAHTATTTALADTLAPSVPPRSSSGGAFSLIGLLLLLLLRFRVKFLV